LNGATMAETVGPTPDYWVAAAAALPIIALGIMAEARESTKRWSAQRAKNPSAKGDRVMNAVKATNSTLWLLYVVAATISLRECLVALRGGNVPSYWTGITEATLVQGLLSTAIAPMLDLLARSEWFLRLLASVVALYQAPRKFKQARELERISDDMLRMHHQGLKAVSERIIIVARIDNNLRQCGGELAESEISELNSNRTRLLEDICEFRRIMDSMEAGKGRVEDVKVAMKTINRDSVLRGFMATAGDDIW
jgi:hypothetical protein